MARSGIVPAGQRIALHPGLVKTATSTMQRHVFPQHPDIAFLGIPGATPELEWAIRHLCQADTIHYEAARIEATFAPALRAVDPAKLALISYENLALYESKDKGLVAGRLAELFPGATVLLTIRRQEDLLISWYFTKLRVRIKRKAFIPLDEWYWVERREPHQSILDDLRYARTLDLYRRLFGAANVHVVPFELLRRDVGAFGRACATALGVDGDCFTALLAGKRENASMSRRYYDFWRRYGQVLPRKLVRKWSRQMPMHDGPSARIELPDDIRADLVQLIAEDNRRLVELTGLDLAGLGYTLDPPRAAEINPPAEPVHAVRSQPPDR